MWQSGVSARIRHYGMTLNSNRTAVMRFSKVTKQNNLTKRLILTSVLSCSYLSAQNPNIAQ